MQGYTVGAPPGARRVFRVLRLITAIANEARAKRVSRIPLLRGLLSTCACLPAPQPSTAP